MHILTFLVICLNLRALTLVRGVTLVEGDPRHMAAQHGTVTNNKRKIKINYVFYKGVTLGVEEALKRWISGEALPKAVPRTHMVARNHPICNSSFR